VQLDLSPGMMALAAVLVCTYFPARCAKTFLVAHPRLFTAMALFAFVWALLIPFYDGRLESPLLPAYGGFTMVFIGGLLVLEKAARQTDAAEAADSDTAQASDSDNAKHSASALQRMALWVFIILATPTFFMLKSPHSQEPIISIAVAPFEWVIGILLDVIGFWSVAAGCRVLFGNRFFLCIAAVLLPYSIAELMYLYWQINNMPTTMPPHYRYAFALLKIAFTVLLSYRVSYEAFTDGERRKPIRTFVYRLLPWT